MATAQMCEMVVDVCLHHHEKVDGAEFYQLAENKSIIFLEWPRCVTSIDGGHLGPFL